MLHKRGGGKARRTYQRTADKPPVDERKPDPDPKPGSHSTGGATDHRGPRESEGPPRR